MLPWHVVTTWPDPMRAHSLPGRVVPLVIATLCVSSVVRAQSTLTEALDPGRLTASRDSFVVMLQGKPAGWQRLVRTPLADGWQLEDAIVVNGLIAQTSIMTFDRVLAQRTLRQQGEMQGRPMTITLDYGGGRATGRSNTPSNPAGEVAIATAVPAGTVDDNAVLPLLVAARWRDSLALAAPMITSGKGTLDSTRLRVVAADTVTVPAGTFDIWRVEMTMGRSTTLVDVTRRAPYRIVRIRLSPTFEMRLAR